MRFRVVVPGAAYDRQVGLGLRLVVEGDRHLHAHEPAGPEAGAQGVLDEAGRRRVEAADRLGDDEVSGEQLEMLARLEDAELDEAIVLGPGPAAGPRWIEHHPGHASDRRGRSQRLRFEPAPLTAP
jgi:hypothetical protein